MNRKLFLAGALGLVLLGCAGTPSIDRFYETHKNDDQVLAIRVPRVMLSMISGISPEMESLFGNTRDLRYMRLPSATPARTDFLNRQVGSLTGSSFIEIFRKNDANKRNVVSVRERGSSVREILVYNNDASTGSLLYIQGDFDPAKVRQLAKEEAFGELPSKLSGQFSATPGITE